jgi:hypothetical protein
MGVVNWLLTRLRNRRFAMTRTGGRSLIFGTIYTMRYRNWKHDPSPLIFVMYSGPRTFVHVSGHYTDGINLHYLNMSDRMWFARMIYLTKKGSQKMAPYLFYRFLKMNRPSIIRDGYRRYHTSMIGGPRMVSAGWTHLTKLVYPFNDPWIQGLNKTLEPQNVNLTSVKISYSADELTNRITQTLNSRPISSLRSVKPPTNIRII